MRQLAAVTFAFLVALLAPAAHAQTMPHVSGVRFFDRTGTAPCSAGQMCLWRNGTTLNLRLPAGTDTALGAGGGGTLQLAYTGGGAGGGVIGLTASGGGLVIRDNATPTGANLLAATDSTGASTYFGVTAATTGAAVLNMADGSSAGVSAAGTGSIIYNNSTHTFQGSVNGAAYTPLGASWPLQNGTSTNTFLYGGTMTGSSIAESHNTSNAYTTGDVAYENKSGGVRDWFIGYPAGPTFPEFRSSGANIGVRNSTGDGLLVAGANTVYIYAANAALVRFLASTGMEPWTTGLYNGSTTNPWASVASKHYIGGGTAPTKAAGACIGGTQTVTLDANATDAAGTITMTGTGTGTASSTCATVTFNTAYATAPHCQASPANAAAAALSGTSQIYIDSASTSTTVFVLKVGSTALVAGTYLYTYDCTQ